jgi:hypothetical protein
MTGKEPPSKAKDAWIIDVPVPTTDDNANRTVKILNTALAKLGGNINGQEITAEDVAMISAEWSAIKSETSLNRDFTKYQTYDRKCRFNARAGEIPNAI